MSCLGVASVWCGASQRSSILWQCLVLDNTTAVLIRLHPISHLKPGIPSVQAITAAAALAQPYMAICQQEAWASLLSAYQGTR